MRGGQLSSPAPLQKRRKIVKTVRINHLRAALPLAAVGLVMVLYAKPAQRLTILANLAR
jgi:hypothetical protein